MDGDGYIGISKKNYISIEITVGIEDLKMLLIIKNQFGGSIKIRSGSNSYRYRLHNTKGVTVFLNYINGHIHNNIRIEQFTKACKILNIIPISPIIPTINSNYFGGLFDSDGTISINNNTFLLTINISNRYICNLIFLKEVFGGNIYYDKGFRGYK